MLIYNVPGLIIGLIGILAGVGTNFLCTTSAIDNKTAAVIALGVSCVFVIVGDIGYRLKGSPASLRQIFHYNCGGMVWFIPLWVFGVVFGILGVVLEIVGK